MQSTYWLEKVLKMISLYVNARLCTLQHIFIHAMQLCGVNSPNLHLHLQLFNFLYTVRDLRPRWSTRRRAGFSCATLYYVLLKPLNINVIIPTIHIIVSFMGYITHVCTLHKRCKTLITKSEYWNTKRNYDLINTITYESYAVQKYTVGKK